LLAADFHADLDRKQISDGITANITRIALRDFTFANGTFIPAGTKISTAANPQHFDPEIYGENAAAFDGFRFTRHADKGGVSHQLATSTSDYVIFGYGRHIWRVTPSIRHLGAVLIELGRYRQSGTPLCCE
jgi:hypothetical protein